MFAGLRSGPNLHRKGKFRAVLATQRFVELALITSPNACFRSHSAQQSLKSAFGDKDAGPDNSAAVQWTKHLAKIFAEVPGEGHRPEKMNHMRHHNSHDASDFATPSSFQGDKQEEIEKLATSVSGGINTSSSSSSFNEHTISRSTKALSSAKLSSPSKSYSRYSERLYRSPKYIKKVCPRVKTMCVCVYVCGCVIF